MKYAIALSLLAFSPQAKAGWCRDMWNKYIIANDPYEGEETVANARSLYPDDEDFKNFLRDLYYFEINRPHPRESVVKALKKELGW